MDDTTRKALRRRLERAIEALDRLGPTRFDPAMQPVPLRLSPRGRRDGRTVRPVRSWSRLVRI